MNASRYYLKANRKRDGETPPSPVLTNQMCSFHPPSFFSSRNLAARLSTSSLGASPNFVCLHLSGWSCCLKGEAVFESNCAKPFSYRTQCFPCRPRRQSWGDRNGCQEVVYPSISGFVRIGEYYAYIQYIHNCLQIMNVLDKCEYCT